MESSHAVNMPISKNVRYVGNLKNGVFHGSGCLVFEDGGVYKALWQDGKAVSGNYIFPDGLNYTPENWTYCSPADRRYWTEIINGIGGADSLQETNLVPTPKLPLNHYDTGDGIYDPDEGTIISYEGLFLRMPDEQERSWIVEKCRKGLFEDFGKIAEECLQVIVEKVDASEESHRAVSDLVQRVSDKEVIEELMEELKNVDHITGDLGAMGITDRYDEELSAIEDFSPNSSMTEDFSSVSDVREVPSL